jgi:hypothetical protein
MAEKTAPEKPETVTNPYRAETQKDRLDAIVNLSLLPCLICFLAFTRPVLYRSFGIGGKFVDVVRGKEDVVITKVCKKFSWLNNADFTVTCDHKPLDIHAIFACAWLVLFTVQALFIKYKFRAYHKMVGQFGMVIATINVLGMIQLSVYDWFYPMEGTARPVLFTPFMWTLSVQMMIYIKNSYEALQKHDVEMHALWMYRAFISSFSTPVIRFYPLVLRYFFGTHCAELNKHKAVIGSMFIALVGCITPLSWFANRKVLKEPMDFFMKTIIFKSTLSAVVECWYAYSRGFFVTSMLQCYMLGHDNYDPATNTEISFSQGEL